MNNNRLFKLFSIVFLAWAIISTIGFAYYYNQYFEMLKVNISLTSGLDDLNTFLNTLKGDLNKINSSYSNLINKFKSYITRSVAILVIDYGNGTIDRYKVYFVEGYNNTVFNITSTIVEIQYEYYPSYGDVFVTGINGVLQKQINETTGYYWMFYINFKLSPFGAYRSTVHDGDIIIWNYTLVSW